MSLNGCPANGKHSTLPVQFVDGPPWPRCKNELLKTRCSSESLTKIMAFVCRIRTYSRLSRQTFIPTPLNTPMRTLLKPAAQMSAR